MHDLLDTIAQVLLSARYPLPSRRRETWHGDQDEELRCACRVAEVIVGVLRASGYRIESNPPPSQ